MRKLLTILFIMIVCASKAQSPFPRSSAAVTAVDAHLRTSMSFGLAIYTDTSAYTGLDSLGTEIYVIGQGTYLRDTGTGVHFWSLQYSSLHAPTLQQTIIAGNSMSQDNGISGSGHSITWTGFTDFTIARNTAYNGDTSRRTVLSISSNSKSSYLRQGFVTGDTSFHKFNEVQVDTAAAGLYSVNGSSWNNHIWVDSLGVNISKDSVPGPPQNFAYRDNNGYLTEASTDWLYDSLSHKVDTIYGLNDSTFRFQLNNNTYDILLRGGVHGGGAGTGTVTNVSGVNTNGFTWSIANPTSTPAMTLSLQNAAADGSTKGQATFRAYEFNSSSGLITLDTSVINTRAYDDAHYLQNITGYISAGSNITITGSGTFASPYVIASTGGGGGGITTLNTLTAATQYFAIGSSGTYPSWSVSGGNTHSINLPITNATNTGMVTPTLYNTWNGKADVATGAITTVYSSNLSANFALISNGSGKIAVSSTTSTDLVNFKLAHTQQSLTDGATITMNCNNGYLGAVTLGGNRTLAITNATQGYDIVIEVIQDGTGSRTLTLPAGSIVPLGFGSGTTINLSTSGGAKDILYGKYDGTNYFWTIARNFQ